MMISLSTWLPRLPQSGADSLYLFRWWKFETRDVLLQR